MSSAEDDGALEFSVVDAVPDEVAESRPAGPESGADADAGGADDEAEDAKWGLGPSEPLVGFGAPPVVAVVVTKDAGDWFAETCASLAAQDYESLSVLVIDNGGTVDPSGVVAEHLPSGFVKRLEEDRGFSTAANDVISIKSKT